MWVCTDFLWGSVCRPECGGSPEARVGVTVKLDLGQQETKLSRNDVKQFVANMLEFIAHELTEATKINVSKSSLKKKLEESLDELEDKYSSNGDNILDVFDDVLQNLMSKEPNKRSIDYSLFNDVLDIDRSDEFLLYSSSQSYFESTDREKYKNKSYLTNVYAKNRQSAINNSSPSIAYASSMPDIKSEYIYRVKHPSNGVKIKPLIETTVLPFPSSFGNCYVCSSSTGQWYPSYLSVRPVCTSKYINFN